MGDQVGRWMATLVARLLATAALWVLIQTSLKNTKWAIQAKEWPVHCTGHSLCTEACRDLDKHPAG
jgi:hypothetical protein